MGELTLLEKIKQAIGDFGWRIYLWGHEFSEDQYFEIMDESYEKNGWIRPLNIR
jgi:hypothetical protein